MFKFLFLTCAALCIIHLPALVFGSVQNGTYVVRNVAYPSQVLDDNRNVNVTGWQSNGGGNQRWKVLASRDSALIVTIQNEETGNFLNRTGVSARPYTWILNTDKNGDTSIQVTLDNTYAIDLAGPQNGNPVKAKAWNSNSASQKWWFVAA
jgi:hypothetical protein